MLNSGTQTIGALAEPFKMSLAAISKHIKILEEAKLLSREKKGRIHECSINPAALRTAEEAIQFYSKFWTDRLDQFAYSIENARASAPTENSKKGRK